MNKTFVFPSPPQPAPRLQQRTAGDDGQQEGGLRDSNALRASVLDAAMELGLGNSSVVANWMFSNAVEEEDETEDRLLSASSLNSYQRDASTPTPGGHGVHFAPQSTVHVHVGEPGDQQSKPVKFRTSSGPGAVLASGKAMGTGQPVAFPEGMPPPPHPSAAGVAPPIKEKSSKEEGKKLKKKKSTHDGNESDGGYMSEAASKKQDKKKKEKEKKTLAEDAEGSAMLSPLDSGERKRKKSFVEAMKSSSKKKEKEKTKVNEKAADAGYETDGGSKKPKRSFFKLSGKSSKGDLASLAVPSQSEVPSLPSLGFPIHERFATSIPPNGGSFSSSVAESTVTSTSTGSASTLPAMAPLAAMSFQNFGSSSSTPAPTSDSPTSNHPPPSALTNHHHLDIGLNPNRDSQVSTGSSSSAGSASRAAPSSTTSHSSAGKSHEAGGFLPPLFGHGMSSPPTLENDATQSFSPTTWTTMAAPIRSPSDPSLKTVSSPLARAPSPIPPLPTVANDVPRQPLSGPMPSKSPPSSMPPVAPLNLDKGGKTGLRIKPSLEKLNLLGRHKEKGREKGFQKDRDEQAFTETLLVPGQTSSALPSPLSPGSPYVLVTPINSSPATSDSSSQSLPIQPSAPSQHGLPHSPLNSGSTSPMPRSRNGRPLSPPDSRAQAYQLHVPRTFISVPNTAVSSPRSPPTSGPSSATLPVPRSRPTNLSFAPEDDNRLGTGSARPSPLASPNVLAYYDIPPPSPPPSGPLPIPPREPSMVSPVDGTRSPSPNPMTRRARSPIPPLSGGNSPPVANAVPAQFPTPAQLRQRMMERGARPPPPSALPQQPLHGAGGGSLSGGSIQRGRESPFPSRRMATVPMTGAGVGPQAPGIESSTPMRYRELYESEVPSPYVTPKKNGDKRRARFAEDPVTSGGSAESGEQNSKRRSWIDFNDDVPRRSRSSEDSNDVAIRVSTSDDDGVSGEGTQESWVSQEMAHVMQDVEDMRDVIERFAPQDETSEESAYTARVVGRRQSFEAVDPANTGLSANKNLDYAWDDKMTVGDRTSRWSGSIYSRVSIMDEEESTSRRDLFVRRVEAMLAGGDSKDNARSDEPCPAGMAGVGARGVGKGTGMGVFVPPVPRIPDMYATTPRQEPSAAGTTPAPVGRNWNKF